MTVQEHPSGRQGPAERAEPATAVLQEAREGFQRAAAAHGGPTIRRFRIGGKGVELHFAGEPLVDLLTPPFGHLAVSEADEDALIVQLWDTASTGVTPPAPRWTSGQFGPRGDIRYGHGHQIRASYSIDAGMLSLFDPGTGHAVCWVRDPERLPPWDLAAPLRSILAWWASATNGQLAHGAAVGEGGVAALLTAVGGSGKSTTALTCLDAGLSYLGDDYVLLRSGEPPTVCSLYNTAKLAPDQMRRVLPHFGPFVVHDGSPLQDKVTIELRDSHAAQLVPMLPLGAILITAVAPHGSTALTPATRGQVLTAMAPATIFQLPGAGAPDFERLASIVRRVACYRLEVGTNAAANVAAVRSVIGDCRMPSAECRL